MLDPTVRSSRLNIESRKKTAVSLMSVRPLFCIEGCPAHDMVTSWSVLPQSITYRRSLPDVYCVLGFKAEK